MTANEIPNHDSLLTDPYERAEWQAEHDYDADAAADEADSFNDDCGDL